MLRAQLFGIMCLVLGLTCATVETNEKSQPEQPSTVKTQPRASAAATALQEMDNLIHNLESKLELDLEQVEKDARGRKKKHTTTKNQTITRLDQDLGQVRSDVHQLVQAIENAEVELQRLKSQMALQQSALRQKSDEIATERVLDELHRGKLGVKVDYVTGQVVRSAGAGNSGTSRPRPTLDGNTTTASVATPNAGNETTTDQQATGQLDVANVVPFNDQVVTMNEEESLEDIIVAARKSAALQMSNDLEEDVSAPKSEHDIDNSDAEMNEKIKSRVKQEIESLREGADPAILSIDFDFLLDIVQLALTAAFFGLLAVFLKLPPTAGFLFGGMLIGPSCLDAIGAIHEVQTLAQFGSMFLLFEQGLLYSQTYSGAAVLGSALATGRTEELAAAEADNTMLTSPQKESDKLLSRKGSKVKRAFFRSSSSSSTLTSSAVDSNHDPIVVGTIVLVLLIFSTLAIMVLTDVVSSVQEAVVVACAVAICSTTIVSENLHAAHIASSQWGKGVLKMISIHDLFMVPLLALPELLAFLGQLGEEDDDEDAQSDESMSFRRISIHLVLVVVFLAFSAFAAKHIIGAASLAQARIMGEKGELFTLSVVAYALLIASMSQKLKLSIEVGAIIAGIILMKSPYVPKVLASIQPITSVFGGMYLTSLGMIISPSFVANEAGSIIELVCLIGMFKLVLVSTVLNRFFDYGITACLAVGSAMAQISEISLLVMAKAQRLGLVSRQTYLLLIPTTCIMLTLAPFSAAHLRRLKMQEVSGNDDGKIPHYLCFLKYLGLLRQPNAHLPLVNPTRE